MSHTLLIAFPNFTSTRLVISNRVDVTGRTFLMYRMWLAATQHVPPSSTIGTMALYYHCTVIGLTLGWLNFCQDAYDLSVWPRSIRGSSSGSRDRTGSNPGHGTFFFLTLQHYLFLLCKFFFFFRLKENFRFCHLQLVFNFSRSLILPRSCLVIMYLFISIFTTEKHYYFKVDFTDI